MFFQSLDNLIIGILTVLHSNALVFNPADVAAQLVLPLSVFYQLGLHAEAPHLLECIALEFHLVQDLGADLHHFMRVQLCQSKKKYELGKSCRKHYILGKI